MAVSVVDSEITGLIPMTRTLFIQVMNHSVCNWSERACVSGYIWHHDKVEEINIKLLQMLYFCDLITLHRCKNTSTVLPYGLVNIDQCTILQGNDC